MGAGHNGKTPVFALPEARMPSVLLSSQAMPAQIGGPLSESEIAEDIRNMERAIQASTPSSSSDPAPTSEEAAAATNTQQTV